MWFNDDEEDQGFGGLLGGQQSAPGAAVGDDPEMRRMRAAMMLASLGSLFSVGGNNSALQAVQAMGNMRMQGRRNQLQEQALALRTREADRKAQAQARMASLFEQQGMEPQQAQAAASQMPVDEEVGSGPAVTGPAPMQTATMGAAPAGPMDPRKSRAAIYRRAADMATSAGDGENAKRYMDIANSLDPIVQDEWSLPQTVRGQDGNPVLVQFNTKTGAVRQVEGFQPKRDLTAPTASADGLVSLDQSSGEVVKLGVGAHEAAPADVKEYQFAVSQGFKGSFEQWARTMANLKAPKISNTTHLSPVIKTANSLGETVGAEVAKEAIADVGRGHVAGQALQNVQQVRESLPEAITGPLAEIRTTIARGLGAVGIGNYGKKLAATQRATQGLARMSLDGAALMEKQGQITQPERALIDRAASAPQSLSEKEIMAATELVERVHRYNLGRAHQQGTAILNNPDLAPVHPHVRGQLSNMPPANTPITPSTAPKPGRSASGPVTNAQGAKKVKRTGRTRDGRVVVEYEDGTREYR